jgi:uncharacterized protein YgiM (DUF1202 family)
MSFRNYFIFFIVLFSSSLQAGQPATVVLDTQLYKEPFLDSESLSNISANTSVDILRRKGGWYLILVTPELTGWVRMTSLRKQASTSDKKQKSSSLGSTLESVISGRSGTSDVTTTTGVKGLDEEDLQSSQPDEEAVEKMKSLQSNKQDATSYAEELPLQPQSVDYLVDMDNVGPSKKPTNDTEGE